MSKVSDSDASSERSDLEKLAEQYVQLHRAGKRPRIESFIGEHPELEDDIRELFPIVLLLDKGSNRDPASSASTRAPLNTGAVGKGDRLGDYVLLQPIGRGGMGVVYEAEHISLHNRVAIKILPHSLNRPKFRERFLREASAAAKMNHPNIVRVFGYGSDGNTHYYVMSLIEGVGLNRMIAKSDDRSKGSSDASEAFSRVSGSANQRFSSDAIDLSPASSPTEDSLSHGISEPKEVNSKTKWQNADSDSKTLNSDSTTPGIGSTISQSSASSFGKPQSLWQWAARLGLQAADALSYAHGMGVIHRDIKPSNIMLDSRDNLFVTDFGLAKLTDDSSLTETGDVLGTLRYIPPEGLHGKADELGDIYGLGLTLYEVLVGEPAFSNSERGKLFHDITQGDFAPLAKRIPKVPRDLAQIIDKATESDPSLRYRSAAAMRDDLQRFLSGEPITARPASIGYRSQRWVARNRTVAGLAGAIFVLLTAATIAATITAGRFRNLANEKAEESFAAMDARNGSQEQTRLAKLRLLDSHLSDAKASALVAEPGRAISGTAALRNAIELSRELGSFESHRDEIHSIAAVLALKPDLQPGFEWKGHQIFDRYGPLDFNGSLNEYAYVDESSTPPVCNIVSVREGTPEATETIALKGYPEGEGLRLSDDGRMVADLIRVKVDGVNVVKPWIHDRKKGKSIYLEPLSRAWLFGQSMATFNRSSRVAYLSADRQLVIYDVEQQTKERRIPIPGIDGTDIALSQDDRFIAVFQDVTSKIAIVDLEEDGDARNLQFTRGGANITAVAWRPDGKQLALATKGEIRIWDFAMERCVQWFPHHETHITELAYVGSRLLAASGWSHVTHFYDPIAQKQIFRCENFLAAVSQDAKQIVLHGDGGLEVHSICPANIVSEFALGSKFREERCGIHTESGTLWVGMPHKFSALDFVGNRYIFSQYEHANVEVDPQGRDVFVSAGGTVYRLPVRNANSNVVSSESPNSRTITFGAQEPILSGNSNSKFESDRLYLSADGDKLALNGKSERCEVVLSRKLDWQQASHRHADHFPIRVACHPTRPIVATSSHHSPKVEVRNTDTNAVLLAIPGRRTLTIFSPDGKRLIVTGQGSARTYDTTTWEMRKQTKELQVLRFAAVSFDSRWIQVETLKPRGLAILETETLRPQLFIPGESLDPNSMPGCFDASGRFMAADRGQGSIGVWDLYKLKQFFESLDLQWPLPGLGNPTPLRDPNVNVEVIWDANLPETKPLESKTQVTHSVIERLGENWSVFRNGVDAVLETLEDIKQDR